MYRAHVSRASGGAEAAADNGPVIERILTLRQEQARRLGYANWAEVSLASKMAGSEAEVERLLEDLRRAAWPVAHRELEELRACAARHGAIEASDMQPWDISTWAEIRRKELFDLDSEALRPWFPLPRVLDGLFGLCERLFEIRMEAADGEAPIWHPDGASSGSTTSEAAKRSLPFTLIPTAGPAASGVGPGWMNAWCGRSDPTAPRCCRWRISSAIRAHRWVIPPA